MDLHNEIDVKRGISPSAATTDNTAFVSQILDRAQCMATEFVVLCGSLADTDATFTLLFEDGDAANLSDAAVVTTSLLGSAALASFDFSADNKVFKIGYVGGKRYCRVTITPAGNTGNVFIAGVWLTVPNNRPTANPPA
jgi:hypothetical protein